MEQFGRRCQEELVDQPAARQVADEHGLILRGLGGTCQGIIGAVAAVGLIAGGQDGRVVQWDDWPDDLTGPTSVAVVRARGVRLIDDATGCVVGRDDERVDVGKHLRPNLRAGGCVLFVTRHEPPTTAEWAALKRV